jgi:hypothetical protein
MSADEKFFAWLDGELSGAECADMEAKVAADPELSRLAEQHRALNSRLKGAFDPIAEAAVPQSLIDAVRRPMAELIDFPAARTVRQPRPSWRPAVQWAAIAATLVVGFFAGTLTSRHDDAPVRLEDGAIYASASLDHALSNQVASAGAGEPVRIGLTYRDQTGVVCRTFTEAKATGLACRDGARWQLRGLFPAPEGQGDSYRMAAGMDPNLAALVTSTISGDPFDSGQEEKERESGWK